MVKLAIIGCTGAVGLEAILILNSTQNLNLYHYDDIKLVSSKSSAGQKMCVRDKDYIIEELNENTFIDTDYAILAVSSDLAKDCVKYRDATNPKCIIIDNSCAFRMYKDVPLIVPEINMDVYQGENIIANPNCSTIIMLMVLAPLHKVNKIEQIDVSTYQASSGAGLVGMQELLAQTKALVEKTSLEEHMQVFKRQYVLNAFSHNSSIDMETKFNEEEIKMILETKKILNDNDIIINPTCVRIPTLRSHMESITIRFTEFFSVEQINEVLSKFDGVEIYDFPERNQFPEPIITQNKDDVYVGRIRQSYNKDKKVFQMLVSGDQIRKGAALNALQIYKKIENKNV
jgi:aspartate-semialdehyde dehydrogenase